MLKDTAKSICHSKFLLYITFENNIFSKHYSKDNYCSILPHFLSTKAELNVVYPYNFNIIL